MKISLMIAVIYTTFISIYTLSDLGFSSNLIGSLSRANAALFTRYRVKKKATIFIHGLCLKLQACGAVYMKQILIQVEQKFVKNPNWWEADQLAIYKAWRS